MFNWLVSNNNMHYQPMQPEQRHSIPFLLFSPSFFWCFVHCPSICRWSSGPFIFFHILIISTNLHFSVTMFKLVRCRSVASASEAAKVGIPLGHYQDCSQVCTNSYHPTSWLHFVGGRECLIYG